MCLNEIHRFLFFCFTKLNERKKSMRKNEKVTSSVSVLVVAVLLIMCFSKGKIQALLFLAAFVFWSAYISKVFLSPMIRRLKYRYEVNKIQKQKAVCEESNTTLDRLSYLLMCHVNHRITGFIKSAYPNATWKWHTVNPEKVMTSCGTGRIELFNAEEYNFADITFDDNANIDFSLIKSTELKQVLDCERKSIPKSNIDPQVWFEKNGRVALKNIIADLSSRGYDTLTINENGDCVINQGDKSVQVSHLEAFPEKVYHQRLIKILAGSGIAAKSGDCGLSLNW